MMFAFNYSDLHIKICAAVDFFYVCSLGKIPTGAHVQGTVLLFWTGIESGVLDKFFVAMNYFINYIWINI